MLLRANCIHYPNTLPFSVHLPTLPPRKSIQSPKCIRKYKLLVGPLSCTEETHTHTHTHRTGTQRGKKPRSLPHPIHSALLTPCRAAPSCYHFCFYPCFLSEPPPHHACPLFSGQVYNNGSYTDHWGKTPPSKNTF